MLSKETKARRRYNRYCRVKSRHRNRRMVIRDCDWIYRAWFMGEPVGPFRSMDERHAMVSHQMRYLKGFRSRMKQFVPRQFVWHKRHYGINSDRSAYELVLEFKRFLTQDLNVRIGQAYTF